MVACDSQETRRAARGMSRRGLARYLRRNSWWQDGHLDSDLARIGWKLPSFVRMEGLPRPQEVGHRRDHGHAQETPDRVQRE